MPNEIPVVFHRVSSYDYHFIIKELVIEFEGELEWLGENKEKYKIFSFQQKRKLQKLIKRITKVLQLYLIK